jgi:hypothetical protein
MRRLSILLAALAAGCTAPSYGDGHLQCSASGACPSGFYCASDQHCWRTGSGPPPLDGGADLSVGDNPDLASMLVDLASADLAPTPSKCGSLTGVLFCDGFENPIVLSGWSATASNGTPSRDTSRAYRGAASLHSHISGAPAMAAPVALLHRSDIFPIAGTLYARVWVYFTAGLPPSFEQFLNFADNSMTGYSVATDSGKVTLDDYASTVYQSSATAMPLDRWACIQFDVQQGNAAGAIHISVDGQLLADLPQTAPTTIAVNMSVGLDFYGNTAAIPVYDAWFDELIVDNKPTTCDE